MGAADGGEREGGPISRGQMDNENIKRMLELLCNEAGFLVRRAGDNVLCGVVNLNIITFEALCSAYLSYYAVEKYAGRTNFARLEDLANCQGCCVRQHAIYCR